MKIRNVLFALALVAVPAAVHAQDTEATITLKASIATSVTLAATNAELDFGALIPGDPATTREGAFSVKSNQKVTLAVTFGDLMPAAGSTAAAIPVTGQCWVGSTATDKSTAFTSCAGDVNFSTESEKFVVVAASVAAPLAQGAGAYTGSAKLTATYTTY